MLLATRRFARISIKSSTGPRGPHSQPTIMWLSITCAILVFAFASANPVSTSSEQQQQHRCGKFLRETLALVCKGTGYYGRDKKGSIYNRRFANYNHVRKLYKRQRSQIVDECCKRSCSLETLKLYCNDDILQDTSAQMSVSAEAFLKNIQENDVPQPPPTSSTPEVLTEDQHQNKDQNGVPTGDGETEATEDDYQQNFGSYSFPDKQKYKFVWAVVYDDQNQNTNNFQV